MMGVIIKYMDKIYKVGIPGEGVTLSSCIVRNEFILEAGGISNSYIGVYKNLKGSIEFEVEVAEFNEASEPLSDTNRPIIDPDYPLKEDSDWKLKHFRKLENILKEEGLLD